MHQGVGFQRNHGQWFFAGWRSEYGRLSGRPALFAVLGQGFPYMIWRIDHRISQTPRGIPARRKMADYLCDNFYLTISGNFRTPTLIDAMLEVGSDRIMFSVDYPFEKTIEAVKWFDELHISERDRLKIGRTNAMALFKLGS